MRTVDEHRQLILDGLAPLPAFEVPLNEAVGLVVAAPVVARVDLPGFDNSAMDGYAVAGISLTGANDQPVSLRIIGESAAGAPSSAEVGLGEAVRIMTGAPMPNGANAVIAIEDTDGAAEGSVECRASVEAGQFIRRQGEDVTLGEEIASAGELVDARLLALLAATGNDRVLVHARPRVAIVSTGAELADPGELLGPGQIHDSNGLMLAAMTREVGAEVVAIERVDDVGAEVIATITDLARRADVIITSGGVSMGAYDVVKESLADRGVEFVKLSMQPGKPQGYGFIVPGIGTEHAGSPVPLFALPGNPVSSFVSFEVFVRPALARLMARPDLLRTLRPAVLTEGIGSPVGRRQFARGTAASGPDGTTTITPVAGQGSHFVADLAHANALIDIPAEVERLEAGDSVQVILLEGIQGE